MFYWVIVHHYHMATNFFYSFGPFSTFKIALSHRKAYGTSPSAYVVPSPFLTADLFINNLRERYAYINDAINYIMRTGEYTDE